MSSLNKAQLIGHLGRDPETRYLPNGDAVTTFSIATSERWKDKSSGEQKEATEWHRITAFRQLAEICGKYLQKGSLVYIEGKIKTRKYTDKDGVEKFTTEIVADSLQMLGGASDKKERDTAPSQDDRSRQQKNADRNKASSQPNFSDMDDDIPF